MRRSRGHTTSVAPRRVRVTQSITVKPDAVPAGETVRAWMPYPARDPGQQENIRFIASTPAQAHDRAGIDAAAHGVLRAAARRRQADDVLGHL